MSLKNGASGATPVVHLRGAQTLMRERQVQRGTHKRVQSLAAPVSLREPTGPLCPGSDLGPQPDVDVADGGHGLREVLVAPTPVVDDPDAADAESFRDLGGTDEIIEIDLAAHRANVDSGDPGHWLCVTSNAAIQCVATHATTRGLNMSFEGNDDLGHTIRCGHLQIVDDRGAVRLEVGNVAEYEGDYEPGVVVYDEEGSARLSMALRTGVGPSLSFVAGGNGVIEMWVDDPGPESGIGAGHLVLADGTGTAVVNISVPHHEEGQWPNPLRPEERRRRIPSSAQATGEVPSDRPLLT